MIGAKKPRDLMTLEIINSYVQIYIALDIDEIITKIRGQLVNIIIETFPEV